MTGQQVYGTQATSSGHSSCILKPSNPQESTIGMRTRNSSHRLHAWMEIRIQCIGKNFQEPEGPRCDESLWKIGKAPSQIIFDCVSVLVAT